MDWMMGIGDLVVFASAFVAAGAVRKSMKVIPDIPSMCWRLYQEIHEDETRSGFVRRSGGRGD